MNEIERDREVGMAWRAASREEPPPELDAAIRAEARRAAGAAPGRKRNKHWWYPLAAAATVAVLAVSIVQLMPPEQVAPTVVADQSAAPRAAQNEVARQSAGADARLAAPPPAAPAAPSATPAPPVEMPSAPPRDQGVAGGAIERERAAAPVQAPEPLAKKQLAEAKEEAPARAKLAQPPPEKPDAAPAATVGGIAAPSPALARSEPFPAKTAPPEARRDLSADEAQKPAANAAAGAPAVQASGRAVGKRQVESRVEAATVANTDEAKIKDGTLSVEDRIKRIRDLKDQGRVDDAARELAAFRAAFGERADALLPPDLRTWAQAAPIPTTK
jgi:hypothetical protein